MPTILRLGAFRFFFYSNEFGEPPHIHIQSEKKLAKFWLLPVKFAKSTNFSPKELRDLEKLVVKHQHKLIGAWNDYFDK